MASGRRSVTIRSFREGDEEAIAGLFNEWAKDFVGPALVTPREWRNQYRRRGWSNPSLDADPECVRVAVRGRRIVGYAVTDYKPEWEEGSALVQELCAAEGEGADEIAKALLADAERLARSRGITALSVMTANEDGVALRAAEDLGFETPGGGGGVFMATITNLSRFLAEVQEELARRLRASDFREWKGVVLLRSGDQEGRLRLRGGKVKAGGRARPDVSVAIDPEVLPLVLLGQMHVGEAYLQDRLSLSEGDREEALRLLDVLFPRVPLYLPRVQWW